ncbi:hypothetical protein MBLNU459_g3191t1 [Dothideomycetes sp. NU459]
MSASESARVAQLPEEIMFSITRSPTAAQGGARLGVLRLPNCKLVETPHYLGVGSRGAVPHLSQDNFVKHTNIRGVYMALEDFVEKSPPQVPPIYQFTTPDGSSPLRRFTALPEDNVLVLGGRRTLPITCPTASTQQSLSILTSVGFRQLPLSEFHLAVAKLRPDIVVGLGDIPHGAEKVSSKKIDKITDRTARWMLEHVQSRRAEAENIGAVAQPLLYAPLLPLSLESQKWYIDQLLEDMRGEIHGLAIYDVCSLEGLPRELAALPRLAMTEPKSPAKILQEIAQGVDMFTVPFIGAATDAGIALDFRFGAHNSEQAATSESPKPLGIDMWQPAHAADVSPLRPECGCYACTKHHRAFLQHLLMAKEMLGWVLLQIHNHKVMDDFFSSVRASISNGSFEGDVHAFQRKYEPELPAKTGQGPRVRGYQFRAEGPSAPKKNPSAYRTLGDAQEKLAETAPVPSPSANADDLEAQGFAQKTA